MSHLNGGIEYSDRLKRLKAATFGTNVITSSKNIYYFTGFMAEGIERLIALITSDEEDILLVPSLHKDEASPFSDRFSVKVWNDSQNPLAILKELLKSSPSTYVEGSMKASTYSVLPGKKEFIDSYIESLRSVKSESEIEFLRSASEIAEKSFKEVIPNLIEGVSEAEIAAILERAFLLNGAQKPAFPTIVAFGKNAANPHHTPDRTPLRANEGIIIDFGCSYEHYNSDTTRTLYLGKPSKEFEDAYAAVHDAQLTGCSFLREGVTGKNADQAVRSVIERKGYGEYFIHRTGHGIGLDVHESPYVDQKNDKDLISGNCVSVEPGVYLGGKFGIRIEDILAVRKGSATDLNSLNKELLTLNR